MENKYKRIRENDFILLQAYLQEIFSIENTCKDNFTRTQWYLNEKYSENEVTEIIKEFMRNDIKCDCNLINKSKSSN